uniref:MTHFR (MetF)-like protein n=1 Tax=uncultured organism TaxID=155900 RepID=A0A0G2YJK7_9ZZZZ|nr:MTHFR (MetF)-like protein [uncultured organism]
MQILAEVHPKSKREKLKGEINALQSFDGFDIPDSPLGLPSVLPSSIGVMIREELGDNKRIIVNQRLLDVNELFVNSLSYTARAFNFDIAFTKGDKPKIGKEVGYLSSEEAVNIAKNIGIKAGMMLSLRKSENEISARIESNADFFLALHFSEDKIKTLRRNVIPYIIVKTEKNKEIIKEITQPSIDENKVYDVLAELDGYCDAVLISSPGDLEFLKRFSKKS